MASDEVEYLKKDVKRLEGLVERLYEGYKKPGGKRWRVVFADGSSREVRADRMFTNDGFSLFIDIMPLGIEDKIVFRAGSGGVASIEEVEGEIDRKCDCANRI